MAPPVTRWQQLHFPHHTFADDEVRGRCELVSAADAMATPEPGPSDVGQVPQLLRRAGVAEVHLIHGTFAGDDLAGIARELARFSRRAARRLNELSKRWLDELVGEVGNYTESFADCLSRLINPPSLDPIAVNRFEWSGENHHLGRADGVMSLLDENTTRSLHAGERILVMAHSHGGNLVAMLSQLVGASESMQRAFFDATHMHYHSPLFRRVDMQAWERVRERLLSGAAQHVPPIDVATFGTPLRYRWNTDVCPKLLHFVQHRPLDPEDPAKASLPGSIQDIIDAQGGDYVQQLGIAGSDFFPSVLAWRDWVVERRMCKMFEPSVGRLDLVRHLRLGRRVSSDGTTLLVDYPDTQEGWNRKLLGHGVYTSRQWLPFHLKEITSHFYGPA